jgi:hypothetical protein
MHNFFKFSIKQIIFIYLFNYLFIFIFIYGNFLLLNQILFININIIFEIINKISNYCN